MSRKLAATVVIGEVAYRSGTVPPDDVAAQITNPAAWGKEEGPKEEAPPAPLADEYIGEEDDDLPKPGPRARSRRSQS